MFETNGYSRFYSIISGDYKLVTGTVSKTAGTYFGSDLRGVTGVVPSYETTIRNSKMNSILESLGTPVELDDVNVRNKIRITCNVTDDMIANACFPSSSEYTIFFLVVFELYHDDV